VWQTGNRRGSRAGRSRSGCSGAAGASLSWPPGPAPRALQPRRRGWPARPVPISGARQWLRWRLSINDGHGRRELTLAQLAAYDTEVRATLDCTSGWYSHQDWTGVPLATLLHRKQNARSVYVHSVTGYWVRFPIHELDDLLLATRVGGAPLSAGHGFPVRLVAPGGGASGGPGGLTASSCRPHRRGGSRRSLSADATTLSRRRAPARKLIPPGTSGCGVLPTTTVAAGAAAAAARATGASAQTSSMSMPSRVDTVSH